MIPRTAAGFNAAREAVSSAGDATVPTSIPADKMSNRTALFAEAELRMADEWR